MMASTCICFSWKMTRGSSSIRSEVVVCCWPIDPPRQLIWRAGYLGRDNSQARPQNGRKISLRLPHDQVVKVNLHARLVKCPGYQADVAAREFRVVKLAERRSVDRERHAAAAARSAEAVSSRRAGPNGA